MSAPLDLATRQLLERCHDALCERLAQMLAAREAVAAEHREAAASGVLFLPTELDDRGGVDQLRRLLLDLERNLGGRPQWTDRWVGDAIDGRRVA